MTQKGRVEITLGLNAAQYKKEMEGLVAQSRTMKLELQKLKNVNLEEKLNKLQDRTNSVNKSFGDFKQSSLSLETALKGLGIGIGLIELKNFAKSSSEVSMQMDALNNRFKAAAGGSKLGAESLAYVRSEAERLGLVFTSVASSFAGFEAATLRSGLSFEQTKQIFTDMSETIVSLQLSEQKAGLVFKALEQMASKGVVSTEELRRQLGDALPGAFEIAAMSMGKTTAEFNKMLGDGEVLSAEFLPKFSAEIRKQLGGSVVDAAQQARAEFARTKNSVIDLKDAVGDVLNPALVELSGNFRPIVNNFSEFIRNESEVEKETHKIATALKDLGIIIGVSGAGLGLVAGVRAVSAGIGTLQLQMALGAKESVILANVMKGNLTLALSQAIGSFRALTVAMLSNPYVAVGAALASLTVGIIAFNKANKDASELISEVNEKYIRQNQEINPLIEKYEELRARTKKTKEEEELYKKVKDELIAKFPQFKSILQQELEFKERLIQKTKEQQIAELELIRIKLKTQRTNVEKNLGTSPTQQIGMGLYSPQSSSISEDIERRKQINRIKAEELKLDLEIDNIRKKGTGGSSSVLKSAGGGLTTGSGKTKKDDATKSYESLNESLSSKLRENENYYKAAEIVATNYQGRIEDLEDSHIEKLISLYQDHLSKKQEIALSGAKNQNALQALEDQSFQIKKLKTEAQIFEEAEKNKLRTAYETEERIREIQQAAIDHTLEQQQKRADAIKEIHDRLNESLYEGMGDNLRKLAQQTITFKGFMIGVLADIARNQAALRISDYLGNNKTGFLASALKVGASAFGIPIPGRASGGDVTAGHPYIVGEKRPELFIPNRSGTIIPQVPNQQQPVVNNITLNPTFQSFDPATGQAIFEQWYKGFESKLIDRSQRVPSVRNAFGGV